MNVDLNRIVFYLNCVNDGLSIIDAKKKYDEDVLGVKPKIESLKEVGPLSNPLTKKAKKKKPKPHALSPKIWKPLRLKVLRMYGRQCMKCGCFPEPTRLHIDHIKPKSKYPELKYDINNLQVLCKRCNFDKGNVDETDYRIAKLAA